VVNFYTAFQIVVKPYAAKVDNRVELFNETILMLLGYTLL
jgi:hypothetical protein